MINDADAIRRFLGGEKAAFELLVTEYQQRIYNFALRMVQNPDDAADLTQEIFILVLRKLGTFRGDSKFSTWLYSIACNTCRDFLRRRRLLVSMSDPLFREKATLAGSNPGFAGADPAQKIEEKESAEAILQSIAELPVEYRMVVVLHDMQGFSYQEIADHLAISLGTVKSRLSRARFKIARELGGLRGTKQAAKPSNREGSRSIRSLGDSESP